MLHGHLSMAGLHACIQGGRCGEEKANSAGEERPSRGIIDLLGLRFIVQIQE